MSDHFAREKKLMRRYKLLWYISCVVPELSQIIYFVILLSTDPSKYTSNSVSKLIDSLIVVRTALIIIIFFVALFRMQREIRLGYRWLISNYMWRVFAIGFSLSLSLAAVLYLDILTFNEATQLTSVGGLKSTLLHWLEFFEQFLPCGAIAVAYPVADMFTEFNKFPEQVRRVSIL